MVADPNVVARDVLRVVQRGALDRYAADRHGFEYGVGIECAGAADRDRDVEQLCARFARLEFVGDRPARFARDSAELLLQREVIDLDHDTVDLVVETVARGLPALAKRNDRIDVLCRLDVVVHRETGRAQIVERFRLGSQRWPLCNCVREEREPALCGQFRIELPHAAGCRVARICEDREPVAFTPRIEPIEVTFLEIYLTANFYVTLRCERSEPRRAQ